MKDYAGPVEALIEEFKKLPGIGSKSAQRLAFFVIRTPTKEAEKLAPSSGERHPSLLGLANMADVDPCRYCMDTSRDRTFVCAGRATTTYSPSTHPRISRFVSCPAGSDIAASRCRADSCRFWSDETPFRTVKEVILAMNPNIEGEATALYLSRLIKPLSIKVTRIATGVPVGGDLEYADHITISRALEGRRDFSP
jgi:recombination protein RecR